MASTGQTFSEQQRLTSAGKKEFLGAPVRHNAKRAAGALEKRFRSTAAPRVATADKTLTFFFADTVG